MIPSIWYLSNSRRDKRFNKDTQPRYRAVGRLLNRTLCTIEEQMADYQKKYWNQLEQLKTNVFYLHFYAMNAEWWNRAINIFLAISSSSSIGAWVIWKEYDYVWAAIIAISQVLTAIKPQLPFQQRCKLINELNDKLQEYSLQCEADWYDVSEGNLTDKEIHDLTIQCSTNVMEAEKKILKSVTLPIKTSLLEKAEDEAELYLKRKYF